MNYHASFPAFKSLFSMKQQNYSSFSLKKPPSIHSYIA